jgi:hypothetical protein
MMSCAARPGRCESSSARCSGTNRPLICSQTRVYLRDVYDHTIQIIDTIENFRDIVAGMLDIYLSSISNRMNAVMKVLTIIATIFIPLTFVAGVYGMNFAVHARAGITMGISRGAAADAGHRGRHARLLPKKKVAVARLQPDGRHRSAHGPGCSEGGKFFQPPDGQACADDDQPIAGLESFVRMGRRDPRILPTDSDHRGVILLAKLEFRESLARP